MTTVGFARGGPIDLGSDSGDEMKIASLGIATDGPIDLGSDLGDETKISKYVVLKIKGHQIWHGSKNSKKSTKAFTRRMIN